MGRHKSSDTESARDSRTKVLLRLLAARRERRPLRKAMMALADCCTSVTSCRHTLSMWQASTASALLRVSAE